MALILSERENSPICEKLDPLPELFAVELNIVQMLVLHEISELLSLQVKLLQIQILLLLQLKIIINLIRDKAFMLKQ